MQMFINTTYPIYYLYLTVYFKYCVNRSDVLILYAFILYYPQDGNLSPKHKGEFMRMNNLLFCTLSAFVGV